MGKTAFIFPGQGAQKVGMGKDFHDRCPAAREVFSRAREALGWDVAARCFEGPQEELNHTEVAQPAILAVSIAIFRALQDEAPALTNECSAVAGLSLGEYSALAAGEALDFADALRLAQQRGRFMEEACRDKPGAMASVIGLDPEPVKAACAQAGGDVWAVNFNSPGQVVISGEPAAIKKAGEACVAAGAKRVVPLQVSGAFHSPYMSRAREKLRVELAKTSFRATRIPLMANAAADWSREPEEFRAELDAQIVMPVLWQQSMEKLYASGWSRFVEIGPGNVLTGLMRRIRPEAETVNIASVEALEKLRQITA